MDSAAWPPRLARSVERVVQEGLTNVRKQRGWLLGTGSLTSPSVTVRLLEHGIMD
ncbi:hypothetical protein [Streptomyces sp. NPDC004232]|uniref:hypothetical protein n=1 Tax=unclassified Streptomyces TaxID=2593676 RepID=UPI0033A38923